jgi:hypothetical protein
MECMICYEGGAKYKIQCGSSVPHCICNTCEKTMRLKAKPGHGGRLLTCPFCRQEEKEAGLRSRTSYEAELKVLYEKLYPKERQAAPQPRRLREEYRTGWCKNRSQGCQMRQRTQRKCSYPAGCTEFVCRNCAMCVGHFTQEQAGSSVRAFLASPPYIP